MAENNNFLDTEGLKTLIAENISAMKTSIDERIYTDDVYESNSTHKAVVPSVYGTRQAIIKGIQEHMTHDISDFADDGHVPDGLAVTKYVDNTIKSKIVDNLDDPKSYQAPSAKVVSEKLNELNEGLAEKVEEIIGNEVKEQVESAMGTSVDAAVSDKIANLLTNDLEGDDAESTTPSAKTVKDAIDAAKTEVTESISAEVNSAVSAAIVESVTEDDDKVPSAKAVSDAISQAKTDIAENVSSTISGAISDAITTTLDEGDDNHAPSAKAVADAINEVKEEIPERITEDDIRRIFKEELAKAQSGGSDDDDIPVIDGDGPPDFVID